MHDVMLDALQAGYAEMSEQQEGVVQAGSAGVHGFRFLLHVRTGDARFHPLNHTFES